MKSLEGAAAGNTLREYWSKRDFRRTPEPSGQRSARAVQALQYCIRLPNVSHTFLPGHRIMVQIQSSWFPLYDRNPQTFVPNIFWAKPGDYRAAVQRVYHAPNRASFVELPVVSSP